MVYLTTVTLYNDAHHAFKENSIEFVEALFNGIHRANRECKEVSAAVAGYGNYISIQPSRHADDETIYLHTGNAVVNMNPWSNDFQELISRDPELAEKYIKNMQQMVNECKEKLKGKKK